MIIGTSPPLDLRSPGAALSEPALCAYSMWCGRTVKADRVSRSFLKDHSSTEKLRDLFNKIPITSKTLSQFRRDMCELSNKETLDKRNKQALQQFFKQRGYNTKESILASRTFARRYKAGTLPCHYLSAPARKKRSSEEPCPFEALGRLANTTVALLQNSLNLKWLWHEENLNWDQYQVNHCYWPCVGAIAPDGVKNVEELSRGMFNLQGTCPLTLEGFENASSRSFGLDREQTIPNKWFFSRLANLLRLRCRIEHWSKLREEIREAKSASINATKNLEEERKTEREMSQESGTLWGEREQQREGQFERSREALTNTTKRVEEHLKERAKKQKRGGWVYHAVTAGIATFCGCIGGGILMILDSRRRKLKPPRANALELDSPEIQTLAGPFAPLDSSGVMETQM